MRSLRINRFHKNKKQTLSVLAVIENFNPIAVFQSLELPDLLNQSNISRIPAGIYSVKKRWSKDHKDHFHILDVKGRSYILIHSGNFHSQIKGCILIGNSFKDINKDGQLDVVNSRDSLDKLLKMMPEEFKLEII